MIFVYTRGMNGPAPEKWSEHLRDMNNKLLPVLARHVLPPEQHRLSIDQLVRIYPPPPGETMTDDRNDAHSPLVNQTQLAHGKTPSQHAGTSE